MDNLIDRISIFSNSYLIVGFLFILSQIYVFPIVDYSSLSWLTIQNMLSYLLILFLVILAFSSGFLLEIAYDVLEEFTQVISDKLPQRIADIISKLFNSKKILVETQADLFIVKFRETQIDKDITKLLKVKEKSKLAKSLTFEGKRYARQFSKTFGSFDKEDEKEILGKVIFIKTLISAIFVIVLEILTLKTKINLDQFNEINKFLFFVSFLILLTILIRMKNKIEATAENDLLLSALIVMYKDKV